MIMISPLQQQLTGKKGAKVVHVIQVIFENNVMLLYSVDFEGAVLAGNEGQYHEVN